MNETCFAPHVIYPTLASSSTRDFCHDYRYHDLHPCEFLEACHDYHYHDPHPCEFLEACHDYHYHDPNPCEFLEACHKYHYHNPHSCGFLEACFDPDGPREHPPPVSQRRPFQYILHMSLMSLMSLSLSLSLSLSVKWWPASVSHWVHGSCLVNVGH